LREVVVTAAINGVEAVYKSPPYIFLGATAWKTAIRELVEKNTKKKKKSTE